VNESELGRDATVAEVIVVACSASVERLLAHEDGVRRGDDPEDVHQARVATRRMRSDLRTFADFVFDPWATDLRAELRWLGGELGAVRDVEVLRDRLRDHARGLSDDGRPAAEHVIRRLDDEWQRERTQLLETLASARYEALRDLLVVAAARPRCTTWANLHAVDVLPRIVDRRWRKLDRGVSALGDPPTDDSLHAVRIRAKRARYATEAATPVFTKPARALAKAFAAIQDVLGEHQDAVLARAWLHKAAAESSATEAFAVGGLAQIEIDAARAARAQFPAVWTAARAPKLRAWL
jgi:CHAD domain-containing protein